MATTKVRRKNPPDLTLRNLRALRRDLTALKGQVRVLREEVRAMAAWAVDVDAERRRRDGPHPSVVPR